MKDEVKNWIEFAREDSRMAELALKEKIYNQACFHAEQCVEKAIKALIIHKGRIHPQSHKIADLLAYLGKSVFDDLEAEIISLDRFYIPTRYPDALPGMLPEGLPTESDAKEAIKIARLVFEKAKEEMGKS
jgi:HEPN domain-containing protein